MFERRQRIGRFSGLRNRHHQRLRIRHALAVAIFACNFHVTRDAGNAFQPILRSERRIVTRTASHHQHSADVLKHLFSILAKQGGRYCADCFKRIGNRPRLLEDFLLHVVAIRSQFNRVAECFNFSHQTFNRFKFRTLVRINLIGLGRQISHIAVFQVNETIGFACQSHRVGCGKHFTVAHAEHQRRALTCNNHTMRFIFRENRNSIGAAHLI